MVVPMQSVEGLVYVCDPHSALEQQFPADRQVVRVLLCLFHEPVVLGCFSTSLPGKVGISADPRSAQPHVFPGAFLSSVGGVQFL